MNEGRAQRGFKGRSAKEGNSDYTVSLRPQRATWKTSLLGRARLGDGVRVGTQAVRVPREPGRAGLPRTVQGHVRHSFHCLVRGGKLISALSQGLRHQIRRPRPAPGVHPRARAQRCPPRWDRAHIRHGLSRTSQSGTAPEPGVTSSGWRGTSIPTVNMGAAPASAPGGRRREAGHVSGPAGRIARARPPASRSLARSAAL